jgi:hypothetical protein
MTRHVDYLRDLGHLLREQAQATRDTAREKRDDAFLQGEAHALYSVVSLMQQQAEAFGIPLDDLAMGGMDPERKLL